VTKSYYNWELDLKSKKKNGKNHSNLGISVDDFKRFVKLWGTKNIIF